MHPPLGGALGVLPVEVAVEEADPLEEEEDDDDDDATDDEDDDAATEEEEEVVDTTEVTAEEEAAEVDVTDDATDEEDEDEDEVAAVELVTAEEAVDTVEEAVEDETVTEGKGTKRMLSKKMSGVVPAPVFKKTRGVDCPPISTGVFKSEAKLSVISCQEVVTWMGTEVEPLH